MEFMMLLAAFVMSFAFVVIRKKTPLGSGFPPGSMGLPVIGHTVWFYKVFDTQKTSQPFLSDFVHRYGKTFTTHLLGSPTIMSIEPDVMKTVLQQEFSAFHLGYPSFVKEIIGTSITTKNVDEWKLNRQDAIRFVQSNLKSKFLETVQATMRGTINSWRLDQIVYIAKETKLMTYKVSLEQMLEQKVDPPKLQSLVEQVTFLSEKLGCLPIYFPGTPYYRALQVRKQYLKSLSELALKSNSEFIGRLRSRVVANDVLVDIMAGILFGAFDTTANAMAMAVKYITDNKQVWKALKEEHLVFAGRELNWEDYTQMHFTQKVVSETLRCASQAFSLFRKALKDVPIGKGFIIPKGWNFVASIHGVHHDSNLFEDPLTFNPWRWEDTSKNLWAFGGGQRQCPGMDLARLEITLFIHYFVTSISEYEIVKPSKSRVLFNGTVEIPTNLPIIIHSKVSVAPKFGGS